jgi:hypothetical protein
VIARLFCVRIFSFAVAIAVVVPLPAALAAEGSGAPSATRPTPVTRQEVWQAVAAELRRRGLSEPQLPRVADLDLPAAPPALAGRTLRVASSCWDAGPQRTQFRLECGSPGQCLPFLAYIHNSVRNTVGAGAGAESCRMAAGLHPLPGASAKSALKTILQPTVRPGDPARAVFLANGFRMTASVTCLERGREGEIIRVRSPDGHVFRARISGPALLEALPQ